MKQHPLSVILYCVNYHSYDSLTQYLKSIDLAAGEIRDCLTLNVVVADNSVPVKPISYVPQCFKLHILDTGKNMGYFGAVKYAMQHFSPSDYDYSIISNVDVLLEKDFFVKLQDSPIDEHIGWIAPQIYSSQEQRDRNPKILGRYAKRKLQILRFLFHYPPLYNLYTHTIYRSKKLIKHAAGEIYAGHGSFIILTHRYFQQCGIIDYPVFLFCEEIYLGEQCRQHNMKVVYNPLIRILDAEHASTGAIRRRTYCHYNYLALSYILKKYY